MSNTISVVALSSLARRLPQDVSGKYTWHLGCSNQSGNTENGSVVMEKPRKYYLPVNRLGSCPVASLSRGSEAAMQIASHPERQAGNLSSTPKVWRHFGSVYA